ncbi:MAG: histidine kinase [Hyphomicrobiaceae bacterium]
MPTFFRFLVVTGTLVTLFYGSMYLLASNFEPKPREVTYSIGTLKIRKQ